VTATGSVRQLAKTSVSRLADISGTKNVPVLDNLAVLANAEDIDAGVLMITGPNLVTVQNHIVALGKFGSSDMCMGGGWAAPGALIVD
jgi:hypothetical protein